MPFGKYSETEPAVEINSLDELDRFVDGFEAGCQFPVAISVEVHGYRVDLLVGHRLSFVHLTPEDFERPYFVTIGDGSEPAVDFWLLSQHHTWFEGRHLVPKPIARQAFREYFEAGRLSSQARWEEYHA